MKQQTNQYSQVQDSSLIRKEFHCSTYDKLFLEEKTTMLSPYEKDQLMRTCMFCANFECPKKIKVY